ncbi:MAG: hypothetical protein JXA28_15060 [Bacteroidetes bacterium]|nr:hypothetical protein [Bacteroidota bacterium]
MLILLSACTKGREEKALSDETFRTVYAEIIYLGELHRGDTLQLRNAIDSLLLAYETDTTALFAAARRSALDKGLIERLYSETVQRFQDMTVEDSVHTGTVPPEDDEEE